MANLSDLRLDMVGSQIQKYRGLYVGLPVISIPSRASSMPNLRLKEEDERATATFGDNHSGYEVGQNVATQVLLQDLPSSKIIEEDGSQDPETENEEFELRMTVQDHETFEPVPVETELFDDANILAVNKPQKSMPLRKLITPQLSTSQPNLIYKTVGQRQHTSSFNVVSALDDSELRPNAIYSKPTAQQQWSVKPLKRSSSYETLESRHNRRKQKVQHQPGNNFVVKAPINFTFKLSQKRPPFFPEEAQQKKPPLAQKPALKIEQFNKTPKHAANQNKAEIVLRKSTSQKIIDNRKLLLEQIRRKNEIQISLQSQVEIGVEYLITTRDQIAAKQISLQRFDKVLTNDLNIRGVLLAVQGQRERASQLLQGNNKAICLCEMGKFREALAFVVDPKLKSIIEVHISKDLRVSTSESVVQSKSEIHEEPNVLVQHEKITVQEEIQSNQKQAPSSAQPKPESSQPESQQDPITLDKNKSLHNTQVNFNIQKRQGFQSPDSARIPFHEPINEDKAQSSKPPQSSNLLQQRGATLEPLKNIPKKYTGESLDTSKRASTPYSSIRRVSDIQTKDLLASMVGQQVAEIERFKNEIGGEEAMQAYIARFAHEWRTGSIHNQLQGVREDRPWSVTKRKVTAFEMSRHKYAKYKATINLLVENYLNRKSQPHSRRHQSHTNEEDSSSSASAHEDDSKNRKTCKDHFETLSSLQFQSQSISTPSRMQSAKLLMGKSGGMATTKKSFFNTSFYPVKEAQEPWEDIPDTVRERMEVYAENKFKRVVQPTIKEVMRTQLSADKIYQMTQSVRHLQRMCDDSKISNADTEVIDPEGFFQKIEVVNKDPKGMEKQDLFYIDEAEYHDIYASLEKQIGEIEQITSNNVQPNLNPSTTFDSLSATLRTKRYQQNLHHTSNFQKQLLKLIEENPNGDIQHQHWLQTLFDEISVSETIQGLLAYRIGALQSSDPEEISVALGQGKQPLGSTLALIREEFAKLQHLTLLSPVKSDTQETPLLSQHNRLSQSELQKSQVSGHQYKQGRYVLLSKMLSKLNYFSHFDTVTRQKLIEISKHQIIRAGTVVITSDDMAGKILVVISGAVSVHLKNRKRPDDFEMVRHTMYPGDSIGDAPLRLILTDDDMSFFLKASIDSDVLLIRKDEIPRILENEIKDLLDHKIMPLQKCALFAGADHQSPYTIFVLANLVQVKKYQYGEVIQKQGAQADDSLFLVVRGYCRTVYESTLLKLEHKPPLVRFCNSKVVYGEIGVVQKDLASVNPFHSVKNLNKEMALRLKRMQPGYLPRVPKVPEAKQEAEDESSPKGVSTQGTNTSTHKPSAGTFNQQVQEVQNTAQPGNSSLAAETQQFATDITTCMMFNDVEHSEQPSTTRDKSDPSQNADSILMTTNRTDKLYDRIALIGHGGPNVMESDFETTVQKVRVMKNLEQGKITNAAQLKKVLHETNLTQSKAQVKSLKDNQKLTVHKDLIPHRNFIGKNNMICNRALLEKDRSIKNLALELEDFRRALRNEQSPTISMRQTKQKQPEQMCLLGNHITFKNETAQETFMREMDKRMAKNAAVVAKDDSVVQRTATRLSFKFAAPPSSTGLNVRQFQKSKSQVTVKETLTKISEPIITQNEREVGDTSSTPSSEHRSQREEPRDPVWSEIFQILRQLLSDQDVKNSTPEQLFQFLNSSQLTVVADSSDLVLLQIRQSDLQQLSEPVRRRIEREIKDQLFVDMDRPFTTKQEFEAFVRAHREEYKRGQTVSDQVQQDPKQMVSLELTKEIKQSLSEKKKEVRKMSRKIVKMVKK